jgi:hypothetical protein
MCSKSNPLVFALDLKSAYEGEHMIFGLLGLANLAQYDVLQLYTIILKTVFYSNSSEFFCLLGEDEFKCLFSSIVFTIF